MTTDRRARGLCEEPDADRDVTCDQPAGDHTCGDTYIRCPGHCTCGLPEPTAVDVVIAMSFEDVKHPADACRDLLAYLRRMTADENDTVHFEVTPIDGGGETVHLSLTGAQQNPATTPEPGAEGAA